MLESIITVKRGEDFKITFDSFLTNEMEIRASYGNQPNPKAKLGNFTIEKGTSSFILRLSNAITSGLDIGIYRWDVHFKQPDPSWSQGYSERFPFGGIMRVE